MKRLRHIILGLTFILLMVICNIHVRAVDEKDLDVAVEFGYNNVFRYGDYLPLKVTLTNNGEDFSGEVLIRYHLDYESDAVLKQEVTLEQGGSTDVAFTMSNVTEELQALRVILEENGEEVYNKKIQLPFLQGVFGDKIIMGILSDNRDSIAYVQPQGNFVKIPLSEDVFPEDIFAMHMFDTLIINNFDVSKLNETQQEVLVGWVDNGGELLIGTGVRYMKAMPLIKKLLPSLTISSTREVPVHALNLYGGIGNDEYMSELPLTLADIGGEGISNMRAAVADAENMIFAFNKGKGNIRLLSFDLGMAPLDKYPYKEEVARSLFKNKKMPKNDSYYNSYNYGTQRVTNRFLWGIPNIDFPKLSTIIIIIVAYILIINPFLYIVLKMKKKRHYMWVILPCLAIVFFLIMYIGGMNTRLKAPASQVVNVVMFNETGGTSSSFGTIINTNKSRLRVASLDGLAIAPMVKTNGYRGNNNNPEYQDRSIAYEKTIGIEPTVTFMNTSVLSNYNFELEPSDRLPSENKIITELVFNGKRLDGTITNGYDFDLTDCIISIKGIYYYIERMEAGKSIVLSTLEANEFDNLWQYNQLVYSEDMSFQDRQHAEQNESITNFLYENNTIDYSKLMFIGWTDRSFYQGFTVNGKQVKKYEKTLISTNEALDYASGAKIIFDYEDITPKVNGKYVKHYYYSDDKEFACVFQLPIDVIDATKIIVKSYPQNKGNTYRLINGDIESEDFSNIQQTKEQLADKRDKEKFYKTLVLNKEMIGNYVSDKGTLTVYVTLGEDRNIQIPEIYVEGIGK